MNIIIGKVCLIIRRTGFALGVITYHRKDGPLFYRSFVSVGVL